MAGEFIGTRGFRLYFGEGADEKLNCVLASWNEELQVFHKMPN